LEDEPVSPRLTARCGVKAAREFQSTSVLALALPRTKRAKPYSAAPTSDPPPRPPTPAATGGSPPPIAPHRPAFSRATPPRHRAPHHFRQRVFRRAPHQIEAPEILEQLLHSLLADPGNLVQLRGQPLSVTPGPVERHRKTVRFVANRLDQMQNRRIAIERDRLVPNYARAPVEFVRGEGWVCLAAVVERGWKVGAVPLMLRLVRRGTDRGKLTSARFLLRLLGGRLGRVRVLLDAWFVRARLIEAAVADGHTVIGRARRDLALHAVPRPPRRRQPSPQRSPRWSRRSPGRAPRGPAVRVSPRRYQGPRTGGRRPGPEAPVTGTSDRTGRAGWGRFPWPTTPSWAATWRWSRASTAASALKTTDSKSLTCRARTAPT